MDEAGSERMADQSTDDQPLHGERRTRAGRIWTGASLTVLVAASLWAFTEPEAPRQTVSGVRVDPGSAYNPVDAGEPLPAGFRQLLPRDAIMPVYEPTFVEAARALWSNETEVIGVEIDGEAKAYPVSFLSGRELVVDDLAGIPILVSW